MHENRNNLNDQRRQDVSLSLEESLSRVEESETINWRQELEKVLADDFGGFIVDMFEKDNEFLWDVEQRSDGESTDQEVDDQGSLVKYSYFFWLVPLSADFIGQTGIETDDDQIPEGEGKECGYTHSH